MITQKGLTLGAALAMVSTRSLTMPALVLKRSSRVIPGLRGTPAGMTTTSAPSTHAVSSFAPVYAFTWNNQRIDEEFTGEEWTFQIGTHSDVGVNVGEIGGNSGSSDQIIEGEIGNVGILLEKETKGLTNSSRSTEKGNLQWSFTTFHHRLSFPFCIIRGSDRTK